MPEVKIEEMNKISVAGLILKKIIDKNIADPKKFSKVSNLDSIINLGIGRMKLHLVMKYGAIEVRPGHHPNPTASVSGTMEAILDVGQGRYHRVPAKFFSGKFKLGGNVMALMPLMSILQM